MNNYKINDITLGMKYFFNIKITENMLNLFRELSGDKNPLHSNKKFAQERGYKDKVVYGMLTATFYSRLVGIYIPGKNCLLHSIDIKFTKPVFVGNHLTIIGEVIEIDTRFNTITLKSKIINENEEIVSKAKINVGVLDYEK